MNILKAIEDNKTKRVAIVDSQGKILQSFAVGALANKAVYEAVLLKADYKALGSDKIVVGSNKIYESKEAAQAAGEDLTKVKTYREVGE